MNDDPTIPAGHEPDPADESIDAGGDDQCRVEYQMEHDDGAPEEAGYGYGV